MRRTCIKVNTTAVNVTKVSIIAVSVTKANTTNPNDQNPTPYPYNSDTKYTTLSSKNKPTKPRFSSYKAR